PVAGLGQGRLHATPARRRLREAVEEEHRRTVRGTVDEEVEGEVAEGELLRGGGHGGTLDPSRSTPRNLLRHAVLPHRHQGGRPVSEPTHEVRYASVGEHRVAYDTFGDPRDPALLMVMGLGAQLIH